MPHQASHTSTPNPHLVWTVGDFELISSDNVSFRVSSRILFSVSEVFADALESGSGERCLRLCDPILENTTVIDRFLELAVNGKLTVNTFGSNELCSEVAALLEFLRKYDCARLMPLFELCLLKHLDTPGIEPMQIFAIASAANLSFVCVSVLEKVSASWTDQHGGVASAVEHSRRPLGHLKTRCPIDPGAISYDMFLVLQPHHTWALQRAWTLSLKAIDSKNGVRLVSRDLTKAVVEFKRALKNLESAAKI